MRSSVLVRSALCSAALTLLAAALPAQLCPSGSDTFWKNDNLPQNPSGPLSVSVIPGLCEGEAAGTYFQMPGGMGTQRIKQVSVGFGHQFGGAGFQALVNVEIYQGNVTFNANGTAVLGTKIFDLVDTAGQEAQIASTAINTIDMTPYNVQVSTNFVVAIRMNFNLSFPGCPGSGAPANFFTDNAGAGQCPQGKNLLYELSAGWVDPAKWGPLPPILVLCPSAYAGNWVIRACTEPAGGVGSWTNVGGGTVGSFGPPTLVGSGTLVANTPAQLNLTQARPNALVAAWFTGNSIPQPFFGGTIHAMPPLNQLFFFCNFLGSLQLSTLWPPGLPPGTNVWFQFLLDDNTVPWGITLSNAVRATTP